MNHLEKLLSFSKIKTVLINSFSCLIFSVNFLGISGKSFAQTGPVLSKNVLAGQQNVITTSVPFLTITPDSRSAGMGDVGVAISPDANAIHWNASKLAFSEKSSGFGLSYAPWLRSIVPDVSLSYLSGYAKIDKRTAVGGSFRYFSLGQIQFTDITGEPLGSFEPNEFAVDGFYATQLTEKSALAVSLRFIYSNIVGARLTNNISTKPGTAGAGDVSYFFHDKYKDRKNLRYAFGAAITNLGSKITYTDRTERDFIPMNLRLGTSWTYDIDEFNSITFSGDINKLLVPTRPIYYPSQSNPGRDSINPITNRPEIMEGMDPDVPVIQGVFQSFYDAPGGFREEMNEIMLSLGIEYWYDKQFAVRAGYFGEAETKGQRKYFTMGIGIRYKTMGLDAAYLIPFQRSHPLQNQMRFSLLLDLAAFTKGVERE
jgi:hypothetical protein